MTALPIDGLEGAVVGFQPLGVQSLWEDQTMTAYCNPSSARKSGQACRWLHHVHTGFKIYYHCSSDAQFLIICF